MFTTSIRGDEFEVLEDAKNTAKNHPHYFRHRFFSSFGDHVDRMECCVYTQVYMDLDVVRLMHPSKIHLEAKCVWVPLVGLIHLQGFPRDV